MTFGSAVACRVGRLVGRGSGTPLVWPGPSVLEEAEGRFRSFAAFMPMSCPRETTVAQPGVAAPGERVTAVLVAAKASMMRCRLGRCRRTHERAQPRTNERAQLLRC